MLGTIFSIEMTTVVIHLLISFIWMTNTPTQDIDISDDDETKRIVSNFLRLCNNDDIWYGCVQRCTGDISHKVL